jgi:hypothetical protein
MKIKRRRLEKLKRVNIMISPEEHQWLTALALAKQTSVSGEISDIIFFARNKGFGNKELSKLKENI